MIFEARIENDWALICEGTSEECCGNAFKNGFKTEGYVKRGVLLYNPRIDRWATVTQENADYTASNSGIKTWYLVEYAKRPDQDDPRRDMLRGF